MGKKIDYGIDAPGVIRNLICGGIFFYVLAIFLIPHMGHFWETYMVGAFFYTGIFMVIEGLLMYWYSRYGKLKHRDRMLAMYTFTGNEKVLDVGTGRGLLMIGAAKKLNLTQGKSIGIDIWQKKDLSQNTMQNALENAKNEGVLEKVEIKNDNIVQSEFESDSFDLILSNLCLHNIKDRSQRKQACQEIFRLLKIGGVAIISDYKYSSYYKKIFEQLGMETEYKGTFLFNTFPPLSVIKATRK